MSLEDTIETVATSLRSALKAEGTKVNKQALKQSLTAMLLTVAKGETVTAAAPDAPMGYNLAGEMLNLAHMSFKAGKKEEGIKMAIMAFSENDCDDLMDIIVKCNAESESEETPAVEVVEETIAPEADAEDSMIEKVLSAMGNNDDEIDPDEDDDDDSDEDNDEGDDDTDSDDDDDEDEDDDMNDATMAAALDKLKDNREVIAAANRISTKKTPDALKQAREFILAAAKTA